MQKILVIFGVVLIMAGINVTSANAEWSSVKSYTYVINEPRASLIAASGFDLAVIDYSRDGSEDESFNAGDLQLMKKKPDGGRRYILAYMSIGEAEDYRFYWQSEWNKNRPKWLEKENPDWKGNFKVKFWMDDWQKLIFGQPGAYLDKILDAGFDGVYLDIVDAYWYFQEQGRKSAEQEMIRFISDLAAYARARNPEFRIVPQNAEDLVANADYLNIIDGLGKEDWQFGLDGDGTRNPNKSISWSGQFLDRIAGTGKLVLATEYLDDPAVIRSAYQKARKRGFIPYATERELDYIRVNTGLDPEDQE